MSLIQDLRHALRLFARSPGLTLIALLSIAITIGATAVVFAAFKTVLLDPFPYQDAGALVQFRTDYVRSRPHIDWVSWADMQDVKRGAHSFQALATYHYTIFNLTGDASNPPESLYGLNISADLFPALGVKPMLGRNILPEEAQPGRDREIILSYGLWTRRFNSDRSIIGQSVEVNGHPSTIIGVMPPGFDFPLRMATSLRTPSQHTDFWAPETVSDLVQRARISGYGAVARLTPGVSLAAAQQELDRISSELARLYPRSNAGHVIHIAPLRARTLGSSRAGLWLLLCATVLFMLIGCANVANLLLARSLSRQREIGVRLALGAGPRRIVRQLVTESCVLALAGGLAGYLLTVFAWSLLPAVAPITIPRLAATRADGTVFAFTLAVAIINGILFGLAPALRSSQRDPVGTLRESASRGLIGAARSRLRSALVVAEVTVAVALLVLGAGLTASFVRLLRTEPGVDTQHVLASVIVPAGDQYQAPESRTLLFRRILDAVRALPGVLSAGTVDALPFTGENNGGTVVRSEAPDAASPGRGPMAEFDHVSAGYLQTMGVPLIEGRWFRDDDLQSARDFAVVNDILAQKLWPNQSALGREICMNCYNDRARERKRVIGVVKSTRHAGLDEPPSLEVYETANAYEYANFLVVRTQRPARDLAKAVQLAVASVDPKQPVLVSASMSDLISDSVADRRFITTLLAITGALALLLAAAGVYGVISYTTSLRTSELGVRIALGATSRSIQALVFRDGMTLALIGIALGLALAAAASRILRSVLPSVAAADSLVIALSVILVIAAASLACWIPAFRATRIDPVSALRED